MVGDLTGPAPIPRWWRRRSRRRSACLAWAPWMGEIFRVRFLVVARPV